MEPGRNKDKSEKIKVKSEKRTEIPSWEGQGWVKTK
jgi:hypothetical protein